MIVLNIIFWSIFVVWLASAVLVNIGLNKRYPRYGAQRSPFWDKHFNKFMIAQKILVWVLVYFAGAVLGGALFSTGVLA